MANNVKEELIERIEKLGPEEQKKMLDYANSLKLKGASGKDLMRFAGRISPEDAKLMEQAIEEECERIDPSEW